MSSLPFQSSGLGSSIVVPNDVLHCHQEKFSSQQDACGGQLGKTNLYKQKKDEKK